jgi:hypothetical protein
MSGKHQFHGKPPHMVYLFGFGPDCHTVQSSCHARSGKAFHAFYFYDAQSAGANGRKISMMTEMGNVYAPFKGCLKYAFPLLRLDVTAIYVKSDCFQNSLVQPGKSIFCCLRDIFFP